MFLITDLEISWDEISAEEAMMVLVAMLEFVTTFLQICFMKMFVCKYLSYIILYYLILQLETIQNHLS